MGFSATPPPGSGPTPAAGAAPAPAPGSVPPAPSPAVASAPGPGSAPGRAPGPPTSAPPPASAPPAPPPQPPVSSSSSTQAKNAFVSPLGLLFLSVAFFFAAALLCLALAFDWIPGYPESARKTVTVSYQANPGPGGLAVYLHPPLSSLEAKGRSQLVAFQFTNRGTSSVAVLTLDLFSAGCFRMEPQSRSAPAPATPAASAPSAAAGAKPPLLTLGANHSAILWYSLIPDEGSACPGESPLVFLYTWQLPPPDATTQMPIEQQAISTGPIRITTVDGLHWERFFSLLDKIVALLLLPVLLAIGNYLLQDLQSRRASVEKDRDARAASQQKIREQKLEVWKTMIPSMVQAIRTHYVPIVRVLSIVEGEAGKPQDQADFGDLLACALLFRSKITHMVDLNGGFYFRNHRGEELCATLANALVGRFYMLSGDSMTFRQTAEKLQPVNSIIQVRQCLRIDAPLPGRFADLCAFFRKELAKPEHLAALNAHALFLHEILDHEINDPFFPFWYDTTPAPLDFDKLHGFIGRLGLAADDQAEVTKQLAEYQKSLDERARKELEEKSGAPAP